MRVAKKKPVRQNIARRVLPRVRQPRTATVRRARFERLKIAAPEVAPVADFDSARLALPELPPVAAVAAAHAESAGAPSPAHVVWLSDFDVNEAFVPPAETVPPEPEPAPPEHVKPQDAKSLADAAAANVSLEAPAPQQNLTEPGAIAPAPPAESILPIADDLFDAQGNLVVPVRRALLPEPKPVVPELELVETPAVGDLVVAQTPAADVFADAPSNPPAAEVVAQTADLPRPSRPAQLRDSGLSLATVRVALWPLKFLYWPVRMLALRRQRRAYERHFNGVPETPDTQLVSLARLSLQFTAACVALLLPIQIAVYTQDLSDAENRLVQLSRDALQSLRQGKSELQAFRLLSAAEHFERAEEQFQNARREYRQLNFFTKAIIRTTPHGQRTLRAGLSLLSAGEGLASVGGQFSARIAGIGDEPAGEKIGAMLDLVEDFYQSLGGVLPKVAQAEVALKKVDVDRVPLGNREAFLAASATLPELEETLRDSAAVARSILRLLGRDGWQRYLVLFQNNAELRGTGGFLGSYALMDVEDGAIINLEVPGGGSYDLQGSLLPLVNAPEPIRLLNARWEFQDANWWPDFPTSAKKLGWFLEQSRGGSVDGVIGITNTLVERMLQITGPIELKTYSRTITADNFTKETQKIVELEYDRTENRPKQFLADFAPRLYERLVRLTPVQQQMLMTVLYEGIREKHLMLYSADAQAQRILSALDWAGEQQKSGLSDYLMVVTANIGSSKTDRVVRTSIHHDVTISAAGELEVRLSVTKTHGGSPGDVFEGLPHRAYVRVYVPLGSRLLDASGNVAPTEPFKTPDAAWPNDPDVVRIEGAHRRDPATGFEEYAENGKTVFAFWTFVEPGAQHTATLRYRLPYQISELGSAYTLIAQKQPGTLGDEILATLRLPDGYRVSRLYPNPGDGRMRQDPSGGVVQYRDTLTTDAFYGVKLGAPGAAPADAN